MSNNKSMARFLAVLVFVAAIGVSSLAFAEQSAGQYIDDAAITTKVKAALLSDSQLKATQVSVETNSGVVKLTGAVDSKTQESEAVRVANKVDGVKSVMDQLTVRTTQED
jgi:osmotically-inducible protein OsmY